MGVLSIFADVGWCPGSRFLCTNVHFPGARYIWILVGSPGGDLRILGLVPEGLEFRGRILI